MNIVLWLVQVALAALAFAGGAYKLFAYDQLANMPPTAALSRAAWGVLGVFEMLCGILLIVPALSRKLRGLAPLAAAALTVESLALAALYSRYSLAVTPTNPLVWVVLMALMAAFVAFGRLALVKRAVRS